MVKSARSREDPAAEVDILTAPEGSTTRTRRRLLIWVRVNSYRFIIIAFFLVLWVLASRSLGHFWVSSPLLTWQSLWALITSGDALLHIRITLFEALSGYVAGGLLGLIFAFAISRFENLAEALDPFLMTIYGIPKITLAPLFILWFGIGLLSKIYLAGLLAFFIVFFNTYAGIRGVDVELTKVARVMGATPWQVERTVVLPSCVPYVIAGLKVALPYALTAAIVGEFIASDKGIGYLIMDASGQYDTSGVFAGVVLIAVIIMLINEILKTSERRLLKWRPQEERGTTRVEDREVL
ncbi:MAG: ABC transporter permease [Candidatus Tectomicrobia bacterium]|nr:ABC transporter permease [Candidatus Tectomicrobia bacterium]